MLIFTNWSKAKFFETDFSAAVIKQGNPGAARFNKLGRPSLVLVLGHTNGFSTRNTFPILGKDAAGNYWAIGILRKGLWVNIEKKLSYSHCD